MKETKSASKKTYGIKDLINYREIDWDAREDFFFLRQIPEKFEPEFVTPDYYCLGMVLEGEFCININYANHSVGKNALMIYRPEEPFKVISVKKGSIGAFVFFTKDFLDYLVATIFSVRNHSFLSYAVGNLIPLTEKDSNKLTNLFNNIFSVLENLSEAGWDLTARNLTSALLLESDNILSGYLPQSLSDATVERTTALQFIDLVNSHFRKRHGLKFYAQLLGISSQVLNKQIKAHLQATPATLINQRLLNESKHLISATNKHIGQIAYSLGFSDPFSFSKYFKKNTGYSPKSYRSHFS